MNETILTRIRRIITGNASAIVTRIEGLTPDAILQQAISEIDNALSEIKAELGRTTAQKHHVTKAMAKLNDEHNQLGEHMLIAQNEGRKDLLQAAISRQIDIEDQLPTLENQLADLSRQETEYNQAIASLVAKRNEMEDELFEFRQASRECATSGDNTVSGLPSQNSPAAKAEQAERAFTRVLQNATGVRRSSIKASTEDSAKLIELAHLNKQARIEARIKALQS